MKYLVLICLLCPFYTFAETSLWKVSKGESELFVGGTVHVLGESDYPLPLEFETAYRQAEMIVFETDLQAMALPTAQQQLLERLFYKGKKTLKDDLTEEVYQKLTGYLLTVNLNIRNMERYKAPLVAITVLMAELQKLGMVGTGVDQYFNEKAVVDGKTAGELETLEFQLSVLENMGKGHENEMILSTIMDMKKLPVFMDEMKEAWRNGDVQKLEKIGISHIKKDFPFIYQMLLVDRNNTWVPKIEALVDTPEIELILVGVLHLVGNEGVFSALRRRGYTVEFF